MYSVDMIRAERVDFEHKRILRSSCTMEYRRDTLNSWDEENPRPYQRYHTILEQEHATYKIEGRINTWSVIWNGLKNLMCCYR